MGFGDDFIQWIRLLYQNSFSRIRVNGLLTDRIPLGRSVCQGCPLSALLVLRRYLEPVEATAVDFKREGPRG